MRPPTFDDEKLYGPTPLEGLWTPIVIAVCTSAALLAGLIVVAAKALKAALATNWGPT